jgi:Autographiviridae endonuclease VII
VKRCTACRIEKPLNEFYPVKKRKGAPMSECKPCTLERNRRWRVENKEQLQAANTARYHANRDAVRAYHLKRHYGISREEYEVMQRNQDYRCAICEGVQPKLFDLSVDHDHETGRVRGLLCNQCNRSLGLLKDDPKLLRKAASYLEASLSPEDGDVLWPGW